MILDSGKGMTISNKETKGHNIKSTKSASICDQNLPLIGIYFSHFTAKNKQRKKKQTKRFRKQIVMAVEENQFAATKFNY